MHLDVYPLRFCFRALDPIEFPKGKPANLLRAALGSALKRIVCLPDCADARTCERREQCAYVRIFEPRATGAGPSGLADAPRPFVFRASHLDGSSFAPGENFHFALNLFGGRDPTLGLLIEAFSEFARSGLGRTRGRALLCTHPEAGAPSPCKPLSLCLDGASSPVNALRVEFVTATELKGDRRLVDRPDFPVLFARIRDRISTLRTLYGPGPLDLDFRAMAEHASAVRIGASDLRRVRVKRRSARSGQTHSLGGFRGTVDYSGPLTEFIGFLEAAQWTGVGRQTVWGKGEIRLDYRFDASTRG